MNLNEIAKNTDAQERHAALPGFWRNLSSHPERSPLNHIHGYDSAHDHPACISILTQNPKPW